MCDGCVSMRRRVQCGDVSRGRSSACSPSPPASPQDPAHPRPLGTDLSLEDPPAPALLGAGLPTRDGVRSRRPRLPRLEPRGNRTRSSAGCTGQVLGRGVVRSGPPRGAEPVMTRRRRLGASMGRRKGGGASVEPGSDPKGQKNFRVGPLEMFHVKQVRTLDLRGRASQDSHLMRRSGRAT